jgi:hypothetical protein
MKPSKMDVGTRARALATLATAVALVLGVAGCPLQTPATNLGLAIAVSSASPLVGDTLTLTASSPNATLDLSAAQWTTSDATIVSLSSSTGAQITAVAGKVGTASLTVSSGGLTGAVTITVLGSAAGNVDLEGPTSLNLGDVATYIATVTNTAGMLIPAAVTWVASGTVAFATPGANTGASMQIRAVSAGPGAVTASAGGRSAQIAVKVTSMNGQLVVTQQDGTAFPSMLALGQTLTAKASLETGAGSSDATTAQWTSAGTCTLLGNSGATVSVEANAVGSCTLTATANGMSATATFMISTLSGIVITGDASPLPLGASRTFAAAAMAGGAAVSGVTITWSVVGAAVSIVPAGSQVMVTTNAVGSAMLVAMAQGMATASLALTVEPAMMQLAATNTNLLAGAGTTLTVTPLTTGGLAGAFASAAGVTLVGATGFSQVGAATLTTAGLVTFALDGATAASPDVSVTFANIASNSLAFTLATVASVTIVGPQGPVRVCSTIDLTADIEDARGQSIGGDVQVLWTDVSGVDALPEATNTTHVTASVTKLGTATIVATVEGVASPVFMSPSVPNSISVTAFSPATVAVGGTATTLVTILDVNGAAVAGIPLVHVSMMSADVTKVSVDAGAVMGSGFLFTATGVAAAPAPGIGVLATWTDGVTSANDVMSAQVPLVVTGP